MKPLITLNNAEIDLSLYNESCGAYAHYSDSSLIHLLINSNGNCKVSVRIKTNLQLILKMNMTI